jgi:hypothetical protein
MRDNRWNNRATARHSGPTSIQIGRRRGAAGAAGRTRWRERLGRYVLAVGGIEPRNAHIMRTEGYARATTKEIARAAGYSEAGEPPDEEQLADLASTLVATVLTASAAVSGG